MDTSKAKSLAQIGLEIEFISDKDRKELAKHFTKKLGVLVKDVYEYHSDEEVTSAQYKLEPDFSGGVKLNELITSPMPYDQARKTVIDAFDVIKRHGSTDGHCSIHLNISFDETVPTHELSKTFNKLKFILEFDEDKVYQKYPKREGSIYAKSIKEVYPLHPNIDILDHKVLNNSYHMPSTKYYGVNFKKLKLDYLEFRYLGGTGYHKDPNTVNDMMDLFIESTYESTIKEKLSSDNIKELSDISEKYKKIRDATNSYKKFKELYPNVKVSIDLADDFAQLNMRFSLHSNGLLSLLVNTDLKDGYLNYDTSVSRWQIKNATLDKCYSIRDVDLVNCTIRGNIYDCTIIKCELNNCNVKGGEIKSSNVNGCKLDSVPVDINTNVVDSYVDLKGELFSGNMQGGIFRSGILTKNSKISKDVQIVSIQSDQKHKKQDASRNIYQGNSGHIIS